LKVLQPTVRKSCRIQQQIS